MDLAKNSADGHTKSEHASNGGGTTEGGGGRIPRQIRRKGKCLADRWPSYARTRPTNTLTPMEKTGRAMSMWRMNGPNFIQKVVWPE